MNTPYNPVGQALYALLIDQQGVSFYLRAIGLWRNVPEENYTIELIDFPYSPPLRVPLPIERLYPRFEELARVRIVMEGGYTASGRVTYIYRRARNHMPVYRVRLDHFDLALDIPLDEAKERLEPIL